MAYYYLLFFISLLNFHSNILAYENSTIKNLHLRGLQQSVPGSKFTSINNKPILKRKPDPKQLSDVSQNPRYPKSKTRKFEYYRMYDQIHNITENPSYALNANLKNKYYLSIIAIFKNEACGIKEWLDHHIGHGVEHFYLVDDESSDNVLEILKPYIDKEIVSMHTTTSRWVPFRQTGIYKKVFSSIYAKNESKWVAIIDLDEYLYAPQMVNIGTVLKNYEDLSVIGVNWMWFGSSGLEQQPTNIIQSFTHRASSDMTKYPGLLENYKVLKPSKSPEMDWQKYIVNTAARIDNIDIHTVVAEGTSACLSNCIDPINPPLLINHYATQSKDFFLKVKSPRGDVNNWVAAGAKNLQWFQTSDINEVPDTRLADQNKKFDIAMTGNKVCDFTKYNSVGTAQAPPAVQPPAAPNTTTTSAATTDTTATVHIPSVSTPEANVNLTTSNNPTVSVSSRSTIHSVLDAVNAESGVETVSTTVSTPPKSRDEDSSSLITPPIALTQASAKDAVYSAPPKK